MQYVSGIIRHTGEQNADMGASRVKRDWKDTNTVMEFFRDRNPFENIDTLYNIANGVHASAAVNADSPKEVGEAMNTKMTGARISNHSFKRKRYIS